MKVEEKAGGPPRDKRGTPYYDVKDSKTGRHICRVATYTDPIINESNGIQRFLDYLPAFTKEVEKGKWGGMGFDSISFASLAARKYHQYELNPDTSNPLQWHGGATDIMEELACMQLPNLPCHVGAVYHVHTRKVEEGEARVKSSRQPFVPGRRMEETKMVSAAWPELWRLFIKTEEGKRLRFLQTEASAAYQAGTSIAIPDNIQVPRRLPGEFAWQGWRGKGTKPEVHVALYGDPHTGKSTMLAQLLLQLCPEQPFYVAMFDARGKDIAYRLLGVVE